MQVTVSTHPTRVDQGVRFIGIGCASTNGSEARNGVRGVFAQDAFDSSGELMARH